MTEEKAKGQKEEPKGQSKEITGQATETVAGLTGQATEGLGSFICDEARETEEGLVADLEAGTEVDKTKCQVEEQKEKK